MNIKTLGNNHSILDQYLAEIRDINIQTDPLRFRDNLNRIGELFAYEISKEMEFEVKDVQTPLGVAKVPKLKVSLFWPPFCVPDWPCTTGFSGFLTARRTALFRLSENIPKVENLKLSLNTWRRHRSTTK